MTGTPAGYNRWLRGCLESGEIRPASDFKSILLLIALTANALLRKMTLRPPAVPFFFGERKWGEIPN
jgi:hypothetical protein